MLSLETLKIEKNTNKNENKIMKNILFILDRAKSPVPLGYISKYAKIKDPYKILKKMEKKNLIQKCEITKWSYSRYPLYEITPIN